MKIMRSRRPTVSIKVPVMGTYRVEFEQHLAVVPDEVAAYLVAVQPTFYNIERDLVEALATPGASVLVIRDMGLGDVLLTTPLIRKLAQAGAAVDVLTCQRYRCLFDGNPHVRHTFPIESDKTERQEYTVVIDLRMVVENAEHSGRYGHRADAFAAFADLKLTEEERILDYFVTKSESFEVVRTFCGGACPAGKRVFPTHGLGRIGYVWRSSTGNRNWSEATHRQVLADLTAAGYEVIVIDHERLDVPDMLGVYNLTGTPTVRDAAAILSVCDAVIAPDTGLFHLAQALGVPTLAYFSSMPIEERATRKNLIVINAPEKCSLFPCRQYHCLNRNEHNEPRCLDIYPGSVVVPLRRLLEENTDANRMGGSSLNGQAVPARSGTNHRNGTRRGRARVGHTGDSVPDPAGSGEA